MLDFMLLRNEPELVAKKLARRKFKLDVETILQQEKRRKKLQIKTENLQSEKNAKSKLSGAAKARGEDIEQLKKTINTLEERLIVYKTELYKLKTSIHKYALSIPNIPADEVPIGFDECNNVEVFHWGTPKKYNFSVLDHVKLGKMTDGLDFAAAVKLTGSRFVVMKGQIARLHRAISQFMLDLHTEQHGYIEYNIPYLVNHTSLCGTGQLPKFSEDLFYTQSLRQEEQIISYALIPTAEVPLTNLFRNDIISEKILPIKMVAHSPCFRSEPFSYGRENRGLIRMHQFDKVELVSIVKPENSMKALEEMTGHAEKVLRLLRLPYRKVLLCTGNMGFSACKTYDLEVWLPSYNTYREVSSCSNTGDFQARRMQTKYRYKDSKKINFLHTLNGSALAVGRTLVAVLENYQLSDGRIEIPNVLYPYMKGLTHIG